MKMPLDSMTITCPFGWRTHPVTHKRQFHNGIDLRAKVGTTVYAPFPGVVRFSHSDSGGNQLILTHPGGLRAGFAHLSRYAAGLQDGDPVVEGQKIAETGETGIGVGPHLHFTISAVNRTGDREFADPVRVYAIVMPDVPMKAK